MVRTLASGGINWTWYLRGDFNEDDKTVRVIYHNRWHDSREYPHPKSDGHFQMVEPPSEPFSNSPRTLIAVIADGINYTVTNPQNIFSYMDMTKEESK